MTFVDNNKTDWTSTIHTAGAVLEAAADTSGPVTPFMREHHLSDVTTMRHRLSHNNRPASSFVMAGASRLRCWHVRLFVMMMAAATAASCYHACLTGHCMTVVVVTYDLAVPIHRSSLHTPHHKQPSIRSSHVRSNVHCQFIRMKVCMMLTMWFAARQRPEVRTLPQAEDTNIRQLSTMQSLQHITSSSTSWLMAIISDFTSPVKLDSHFMQSSKLIRTL